MAYRIEKLCDLERRMSMLEATLLISGIAIGISVATLAFNLATRKLQREDA